MSFIVSPFRIVIIFLGIVISCLLCLSDLNISLLSPPKSRQLNITFDINGYSPEQTEQQVTSVLENAVSQTRNLKGIISSSGNGHGIIEIYFDKGEDLSLRILELRALIRKLQPLLPAGCSYPAVSEFVDNDDQSSSNFIVSVRSDDDPEQVKETAENLIGHQISNVEGINGFQISGSNEKYIAVNYDLNLLNVYGIRLTDILHSIDQHHQSIYPGSVNDERGETLFIKSISKEQGLESLRNIIIENAGKHRIVRLKDIAKVGVEDQPVYQYLRINGENAINIVLSVKKNANLICIADKLRTKIVQVNKVLPSGYSLIANYDQTTFLSREISKNYRRMWLTLSILLLFIFFTYRNKFHVINLFLTLVVNFCLIIISVWALDINLHIYSLAGMAVGFGMMIDHAIIMLDYYHQYRNRKVSLALIGATLTTIAALLLVYFLPEEQRGYPTDFTIIIIIALTSSIITNLWFTVALYDLLFKSVYVQNSLGYLKKKLTVLRVYYSLINSISRYRICFMLVIILVFGIPLFLLPGEIEGQQWYSQTFGSKSYQQKIGPVLNRIIGGTSRLFYNSFSGRDIYKDTVEPKLFINAVLPSGSEIEDMNSFMRRMEVFLGKVSGVQQFITHISSGESGSIEVTFADSIVKKNLPYIIKSRVIDKAREIGGAEWEIYGVGQGFSNSSAPESTAFKVELAGYNYDDLEKYAELFKIKLKQNVRIENININERVNSSAKESMEYTFALNRYSAAVAGVDERSIFQAIKDRSENHFNQSTFQIGKRQLPLILTGSTAASYQKWDILKSSTYFENGTALRLGTVVDIKLNKTVGEIIKKDRSYMRVVGFDYLGSIEYGDKFLKKAVNEMKLEMPMGYSIKRKELDNSFNTAGNGYPGLLFGLLIADYIICAILFENLKQPFYIILIIPVSFIGIFLLFPVFGMPFDQGGFASFIMLGGLVVNAGIFIMNDYNRLLKIKGQKANNKLLIKAIFNRGRTIMLTTLATICGMLPFIYDRTEIFWYSFAMGNISGLFFSIFSIFIVLPVLLWETKQFSISNKV